MMLSTENADYRSRIQFLNRVRRWMKENGMNFIGLARKMEVNRASVSLWFAPANLDKPLIDMRNIKKLSELTGIDYTSKSSCEIECLDQLSRKL